MSAPLPEGATPLQSALWEMGRLMQVFGENSVSSMEYVAKRLIDQDKHFQAMVADASDEFFTLSHQLQGIINREFADRSPVLTEMHGLILGMMHGRRVAAARAATALADLQQTVRDLTDRVQVAEATPAVQVDGDVLERLMRTAVLDYCGARRRVNACEVESRCRAVLDDFVNTFARHVAADLQRILNHSEATT